MRQRRNALLRASAVPTLTGDHAQHAAHRVWCARLRAGRGQPRGEGADPAADRAAV